VKLKILFFGQLRDIVGKPEELLEMPEGSVLGGVFDHYAQQYPRLGALRGSVVLARNQEFAPAQTVLETGDEVAFLPPVSGGSEVYTSILEGYEGHFFALTRSRIESEALVRRILRPEDGAVVTFEGVVRNNTKGRATLFLDYEGYEGMALKQMAEIGKELATSYAIGHVAMVHRLGRLQIGEASVVIVVTAPHRKPAFDAALEGINRLKRSVPIWKKEYFADGAVWVEGEWDDSIARP
jgi:MoaE-MoaD fusion protein